MLECRRVTLYDFYIMERAWELRTLDDRFMASYGAWQLATAQASDKKGRPLCKRFKDLFDYDKERKAITGVRMSPALLQKKAILEQVKKINLERR